MTRSSDSKRVPRLIHLTETEDVLVREIAERTDGGNVSRLLRRLIRDEAGRRDVALPKPADRRQAVAA